MLPGVEWGQCFGVPISVCFLTVGSFAQMLLESLIRTDEASAWQSYWNSSAEHQLGRAW